MIGRTDRVVIDTLLPRAGHLVLPLGAFDAGFDDFYEDFERTATRRLRLGFRLGLVLATWLAPLLIGRRPPLPRLGRADRERALEAMERSRYVLLRDLLVALKLVVSLAYGADARVRRSIGVP